MSTRERRSEYTQNGSERTRKQLPKDTEVGGSAQQGSCGMGERNVSERLRMRQPECRNM